MRDRRSEDRLYSLTVAAFLVGLVALGLLGVPALLVAAIGAAVAGLGIVLFGGFFSVGETARRRRNRRERVPARYVPSVLEGSAMRRRRLPPLRRHRHASPPLRFR
jgi:predicted lysophospholipase L1 biosynthesis ABC-type transport system permease subunit